MRAAPAPGPTGFVSGWLQKIWAVIKLFFSTIFMPKDPSVAAGKDGGSGGGGTGSNVRRINPGGSSHTQFGSGRGGGDDDNDFMRRGRFRDNR
mmetsp:Transcript_1297/g.2819  ORF Transcript_1297/g.2819 Transcript_1297/m.2819 type:complete len:93 (+) Transcript_1297:41-319(+)